MKDFTQFLNTLADIVDTNQTHVLSFELRKLSSEDRQELGLFLRNQAREAKKGEK